jgi:hypothetical protein
MGGLPYTSFSSGSRTQGYSLAPNLRRDWRHFKLKMESYEKGKKVLTIPFSHNWNNKLGGDAIIFTTIRKWRKDKEDYYKSNIGNNFQIALNTAIEPFTAKLLNVESKIFRTLPQATLMTDTGANNMEEVRKIFAAFNIEDNDLVIILTLEKETEK